jgi:MSHA biogenesis protein MshO
MLRANRRTAQRGFTLVELIMVIVLLGIVSGILTVFMKGPIDAYFSGGRRAALTDVADTTVRRIARDLHRALPNSVRSCTSPTIGVEFIPTKTGGRYRADGSGALDFTAAATSFNAFGDYLSFAGAALPSDQQIARSDVIVIYNLGITGADAYQTDSDTTGTNWTTVPAGATLPLTRTGSSPLIETTIPITSFKFPLPSPGNRFHVVSSTEKMVSYVCSASTLYRTVSGTFTYNASCPATGAKIATNVDCTNSSFTVSDTGNALNRNGLVSMRITLQDSTTTETVTVQHEVHMDNTP